MVKLLNLKVFLKEVFMKIRTACILILPFLFFTSKITYGANLCDYYFKRMEYERAIEECTRAINSADKNSAIIYEYYSTRGTVYKIIGKYDEALSDFNSAVKSGTESKARLSITYNDRGNLYQLKGLYDHAISDYEKAIELDQDSYIGTYNIASKTDFPYGGMPSKKKKILTTSAIQHVIRR
jgi:tetratricopeptide (TPR) repeat protein